MVIAVVFGASGTAFPRTEGAGKFIPYVSPGNYFTCLLPEGWRTNESSDPGRDATRVYGVEVYHGNSDHKVAISVKYYAADNSLYKSVDRFIEVHSKPVFGGLEQEGEKYGPVQEVLVKGVKAKVFERALYEFEDHVLDPASGRYYEPMTPKKFQMVERYVVVPAKAGFFVLQYRVSPEELKVREEIFTRVMESFEMSVK